jgi:hypothetical protein
MPIIMVLGTPNEMDQRQLERLCLALRDATALITELNLTHDQVSVFFPPDRLTKGLGEEIIINVVGLFDKPERTPDVRKRLAEMLVKAAQFYLNEAGFFPQLVEAFVNPFDEKQGFAQLQA